MRAVFHGLLGLSCSGILVASCDGTDTVSIPAPGDRDASTSPPLDGVPPRDAGGTPPDEPDATTGDASTGDASTEDTGDGGDAAPPETRERYCARKDREFLDFVAQNRTCSVDADCTTIGDCGPNIDGQQLNVAAAQAGYALMQERCFGGGFDGPTYGARCQDGQCTEAGQSGCCGCLRDAGRFDE